MLTANIFMLLTSIFSFNFPCLLRDGGRGGDPFRRPNSKFPSGNNGNRPSLPPGMIDLGLALFFFTGAVLLFFGYLGNIRPVYLLAIALAAILLSRLAKSKLSDDSGQNKGSSRDSQDFRESDPDFEREEENEAEAYWRRREEEDMREEEQRQNQDFDHRESRSGPDLPKNDPWDRYRSWPEHSSSMEKAGLEPSSFPQGSPQGFDRHEFITGAKIVFEKVQEAMAAQDLGPVRPFLSAEAASEIERDMGQAGSKPRSCSLLAVDASIRDILEKGEGTEVIVAFNAVIHSGSDDTPREIESAWRFFREHAQDNWRLDSVDA